jgi:hypothetical protein
MGRLFMRVYAGIALAVTVVGLGAMLVAPPASTRFDSDGVAYFTPKVINPADGKAVDMNVLIRNYRGD